MNRTKFYAALRRSSLFPGGFSQPQVDGVEALLDSCIRNKVANGHHVANILAQVYHETGRHMLGIKETVFQSHTNKNPSDAVVKARLDTAFASGKLTWVKTPYWRDGWFGRGPIQLTHKTNYEKMGRRLGVNLVGNPSLALDPKIGADIAVVGMSEGMFTGRRLSQFSFPAALDAPVASNPRRIVNGQDGTDKIIAGYHRTFYAAIQEAGGWSLTAQPVPIPAPKPVPPPPAQDAAKQGVGALIIGALALAGAWLADNPIVAVLVVAALVAAVVFGLRWWQGRGSSPVPAPVDGGSGDDSVPPSAGEVDWMVPPGAAPQLNAEDWGRPLLTSYIDEAEAALADPGRARALGLEAVAAEVAPKPATAARRRAPAKKAATAKAKPKKRSTAKRGAKAR